MACLAKPCHGMLCHVMSCYIFFDARPSYIRLWCLILQYTLQSLSLLSPHYRIFSLHFLSLPSSSLVFSYLLMSCLVLSWLVFSPLLLPSFLYLAFSPQVFSSPFFLNPLFFVLSPPMAALEIELPWKIDPGTPPWKSIQPTRNQNLNQHYT